MANELQYYANPDTDTGQSITAKVYDDAGSQVGSDVVCSEVGTLAIYHGDMPASAAGVYTVRFFESSAFVAQGTIEWDGSDEITRVSLAAAISDRETRSEAISHYQSLITEHTDTQTFIAALNDFDPANDIIGRVTLVDTTTTNSDMRGTDGASTVEPDNATITAIAADTADLQANQGDWLTATGFSVHSAADVWSAASRSLTDTAGITTADMQAIATAVESAILDESDGNQILNAIVGAIGNSNVDEIALVAAIRSDLERSSGKLDNAATAAQLAAQTDALSAEQTTTRSAIASLNDFDPANDSVAHVTLVDTTTTNSDMRGTDGAATTTRVETLVDILVDDHTVTQTAIAELNDLSAAEFRAVIIEGLVSHRTLTDTDLNDAMTQLEDYIDDNAGLTVAQDTALTLVRDLAEADESYTADRATKYIKGTTTAILDKSVDSTTLVDVTTTVTEYADS